MKLFSAIVVATVLTAGTVSVRTQTLPPVPATPENAASFLGEWTITASSSSYGETTVAMTLKVADGKIAGEVSDANGKHQLSDISKSGSSLVAYYVFDYQGTPVDTVVTLTPNDNNVSAYLDFANGAAQFAGTATKKP
jgi:hypothetical protein